MATREAPLVPCANHRSRAAAAQRALLLAVGVLLLAGCELGDVDPLSPSSDAGAASGPTGGGPTGGGPTGGGAPGGGNGAGGGRATLDAGAPPAEVPDAGPDGPTEPEVPTFDAGISSRDAGSATEVVDGGSTPDIQPSAGCGKSTSMPAKSTVTITSAGLSRKYILWLPENYDKTHPYRLVLAYHWYTGSAQQVVDCTTEGIRCYTTQNPFFGLWPLGSKNTIFIAPDGIDAGWANTNGRDLTFTDDLLKKVEDELCVDKSRVFANGFSYGGAMSATLACARASVFRAVAVYAGGLNLSDPTKTCANGTPIPIAYYGSHGTGDSGFNSGAKARDFFVKANGCTEQTAAAPPSGGHACTSYQGCSKGHPVRWCAFDGGHTPSPVDRGASSTWNPKEVWTFFTQF